MDKDLLGGIYDDLFTAGKKTLTDLKKTVEDVADAIREEAKSEGKVSGGRPSAEHPDQNSAGSSPSPSPSGSKEDVSKTPEEAVKDAEDALEEARKMMEDPENPIHSIPQTAQAVQAEAQKSEEPETDPMEDLDALIGLTTIKHDVKELMAFVKVQKMRKDSGLKSVPTSLHLVFTGNPGTGKTTVARIIGRLYKQIGVLSKGQLIEVDRSGLVAGYVGQTAIKTQEKIQEAMGGVLFIDEAYALAGGDQDSFGQEAINTILKAMEDHRDDLIIIVAGYTEPMERFINSNPGLKSRFNKYIEFSDYTMDELMGIFDLNCRKYDYVVEEEARVQIRALLAARKFLQVENFANGREVRNLFEEVITNQARRLSTVESPTEEQLRTITLEDLVDTCVEDEEAARVSSDAARKEDTAPEELPAAENTSEIDSTEENKAGYDLPEGEEVSEPDNFPVEDSPGNE